MNAPVLPGLPEPIRNKHGVPLFSSTQVGALQIATWNAARDHFAGLCDKRVIGDNNREDQEAARCAAAIRQSPDPKETT